MALQRVAQHTVFGLCFVAAGCTITAGNRSPNDAFVPPNSQVRVIGPVTAQMTKVRFMGIASAFETDEVLQVHRDALAKVKGANVILNVGADTKTMLILPITISHYTVTGEAAEVRVFDPAGNN